MVAETLEGLRNAYDTDGPMAEKIITFIKDNPEELARHNYKDPEKYYDEKLKPRILQAIHLTKIREGEEYPGYGFVFGGPTTEGMTGVPKFTKDYINNDYKKFAERNANPEGGPGAWYRPNRYPYYEIAPAEVWTHFGSDYPEGERPAMPQPNIITLREPSPGEVDVRKNLRDGLLHEAFHAIDDALSDINFMGEGGDRAGRLGGITNNPAFWKDKEDFFEYRDVPESRFSYDWKRPITAQAASKIVDDIRDEGVLGVLPLTAQAASKIVNKIKGRDGNNRVRETIPMRLDIEGYFPTEEGETEGLSKGAAHAWNRAEVYSDIKRLQFEVGELSPVLVSHLLFDAVSNKKNAIALEYPDLSTALRIRFAVGTRKVQADLENIGGVALQEAIDENILRGRVIPNLDENKDRLRMRDEIADFLNKVASSEGLIKYSGYNAFA